MIGFPEQRLRALSRYLANSEPPGDADRVCNVSRLASALYLGGPKKGIFLLRRGRKLPSSVGPCRDFVVLCVFQALLARDFTLFAILNELEYAVVNF